MYYVFKTISLLLNLVNVVAHTFGCYLLVLVQKNKRLNNTQLVYLIHLSSCEALMNLLQLLWLTPRFFITHCGTIPSYHIKHLQYLTNSSLDPCTYQNLSRPSPLGNASIHLWSDEANETLNCFTDDYDYCSLYNQLDHYLQIIMYLGVSVVFYLTMILLTLDRLMRILFITKFPIYWTVRRAKMSMAVAWSTGLMGCISISIILHFTVTGHSWKEIAFKYFFTVLDFICIVIAVTTYLVIFHKYKKSCSTFPQHTQSTNSSTSTKDMNTCTASSGHAFWRQDRLKSNASAQSVVATTSARIEKSKDRTVDRRSRFFVAVFLILTFLLFIVVPDLAYLLYGIIYEHDSTDIMAVIWVFFGLGNLSDALIYTFMYRPVKILFWKKIKVLFGCFAGHYGNCCGDSNKGAKPTTRTEPYLSPHINSLLLRDLRESDL